MGRGGSNLWRPASRDRLVNLFLAAAKLKERFRWRQLDASQSRLS